MQHVIRPGDVLAGRYRLVDLLDETSGGLFWRAYDSSLDRSVAVHIIRADDDRATLLREAARTSARVVDRHLLRVLDVDHCGVGGPHDADEAGDELCFVVNEWATGTSLDIMLADEGPLAPRRAAWMIGEVAAALEVGHAAGVAHGRLVPENVLVDRSGSVRVIGYAVDAALHGLPPGRVSTDVADLGALVYCALTARWPGVSRSAVKAAPLDHGRVLRARQVRAGVPRVLDALCDAVLDPHASGPGSHARGAFDLSTAGGIADALREFVGDPAGLADAERARVRRREAGFPGALPPHAGALVIPGVDLPSVPAPEQATGAGPEAPSPTGDAAHLRPEPEPGPAVGPAGPEADGPTAPVLEIPGPDHPDPDHPDPDHPDPTGPATPATRVDQPTEAGIPIFDDSGEVSWLAARPDKPPPPPPFEEVPERPLFAPDPVDGRPARRARAAAVAGHQGARGGTGYWPWDTTTGHGTRAGSGTGTGSGVIEPVVDLPEEAPPPPGRSWLWLAGMIAAAVVLLLALVFAFNIGRGRTPLGGDTGTGSSTSTSEAQGSGSQGELTPYQDLTAADFDPQGDPPEEHHELAPLAVDGDPETAWRTMTYSQQLGPGGLKTGVGLTVDLGTTGTVSRVDLTFVGSPTGFSVFVSDTAPTGVRGLTPVASLTASEASQRVSLDPAVTGRYVTIWLTSLPTIEGGYRGAIAEVAVLGSAQ